MSLEIDDRANYCAPGWQGGLTAARHGSWRRRAAEKAERDAELDEALAETFPASDPVSVIETAVPGRPRN